MPARGRPRLTPAEYQDRLRSYCQRYSVSPTAAGIPPFPTGRRETDQHRQWLALYRAHSRLASRSEAGTPSAPDDCRICGRPVDAADAVTHRTAILHVACHGVVSAVEPLGLHGLERLRTYLWPRARP